MTEPDDLVLTAEELDDLAAIADDDIEAALAWWDEYASDAWQGALENIGRSE